MLPGPSNVVAFVMFVWVGHTLQNAKRNYIVGFRFDLLRPCIPTRSILTMFGQLSEAPSKRKNKAHEPTTCRGSPEAQPKSLQDITQGSSTKKKYKRARPDKDTRTPALLR